ncbi:MAG: site-specific DNA-methyltransferase, partial [Sulfurospirillum sp.]|nr:site-specific DNA-methyltransferase [Sulfurospirillum sp.]
AEWKELFDVDIQSVNDLKEEKYLVLDTKFFDMKFKYKLLSEFDNLDEQIDGVLINSENFGALNLLQTRHKEQVKTVYIDPPYNTGSDFLYNDSYRHSSWITFIQDRLLMMKKFMAKSSRFFCSIDDRENNRLLELLYLHLGKENYLGAITWEKRTKSQNTKTSKYMLQSKIEYIHPFRFEDKRQEFNLEVSGQKEYLEEDKVGNFRYQRIEEMSSEDIRGRQTMIYPILNVLPKNGNQWKLGKDTIYPLIDEGKVVVRDNKPYIITRPEDEDQNKHKPFWSHFFDKDTYGTAETGLKMINKDFGFGKDFDTVKPIQLITKLLFHDTGKSQIILDYFAGSGTTGHAVINLNREDNGTRKYILVEMGEYFDTVTKPRIQKVIYSDSWKDGKPTTKNGISQIFKYFKLESYEDTLNNLEFKKTKEQNEALDLYADAKEDYILNYSLRFESQGSLLNIDTFSTPFNYKLKIATSSVGETKDTNIDLVETFNYLLGLVVERVKFDDGFLTVVGKNLKNTKILVIWRDKKSSKELNNFVKKIKLDKYDDIYINGDTNLENVKLIEQEFKRLMFNE